MLKKINNRERGSKAVLIAQDNPEKLGFTCGVFPPLPAHGDSLKEDPPQSFFIKCSVRKYQRYFFKAVQRLIFRERTKN